MNLQEVLKYEDEILKPYLKLEDPQNSFLSVLSTLRLDTYSDYSYLYDRLNGELTDLRNEFGDNYMHFDFVSVGDFHKSDYSKIMILFEFLENLESYSFLYDYFKSKLNKD